MKLITLFVLFTISSIAIAEDEVVHLVGSDSSSYEELSKLKMQSTLIASAEKYKQYGEVERATHHDMAFPKDREEYVAMQGFGVLWVTSHSQNPKELPIKNIRIYIKDKGTVGIDPIYVFPSKEKHQLVAKVLGKHRSDAIYMIPFYAEMQGGTLLADYSANRTDFVMGNITPTYPSEIGMPFKLSKDVTYPEKAIFRALLEREYPISKYLISNQQKPNKSLNQIGAKNAPPG